MLKDVKVGMGLLVAFLAFSVWWFGFAVPFLISAADWSLVIAGIFGSLILGYIWLILLFPKQRS